MTGIQCPVCGKLINYDAEKPVFCFVCGSRLEGDLSAEETLIAEALKEKDPVRRHDKLLQAKAQYPESLEVERQLLYLGRLWERGGKPDFYRIPFWPLSVFETPRLFSKKQREQMIDTFFDNPELDRVANMSPDRQEFINEYLEYMAKEYVEMFIKSSTSNTTFLGFRRKPEDVMKKSASCLCAILKNIDKNDMLDTGIKMRLEWAFNRAFGLAFEEENGAEYLKSLL